MFNILFFASSLPSFFLTGHSFIKKLTEQSLVENLNDLGTSKRTLVHKCFQQGMKWKLSSTLQSIKQR